jgi:hypothetical protein
MLMVIKWCGCRSREVQHVTRQISGGEAVWYSWPSLGHYTTKVCFHSKTLSILMETTSAPTCEDEWLGLKVHKSHAFHISIFPSDCVVG